MSDFQTSKYEQLRTDLLVILQQTGADYSHIVKQLDELLAENERLKNETAKLRSTISVKNNGSSMSSKLRDALRE
jgi:regulator of replication initiation timing